MTIKIDNKVYVIEFKVDQPGKALEQIRQKGYHEQYIGTGAFPFCRKGLRCCHTRCFLVGDAHPPLWNLLFCGRVGISFDSAEKNITDFAWERLEN